MGDSRSLKEGTDQRTIKAEHYLWIVVPLILGAQMAESLTGQGIPVLYPFIQNEFGLSRAQVGLITSAYGVGGLSTAVLAGWLTDYLGVRRVIVISLLGLTGLTMAFLLANSWAFVLALMALVGIVMSPGYPAATRAIMDWVPGRIRALAMSVKQTGVSIGGVLTAAMLPVLAVAIGWRIAAAVTGMLVLLVAIVFLLFYRDAPRSGEGVHKSNYSALQTILQDRGLVITLIWGATFVGLQYIVLSYFMLFLVEKLQFPPTVAGGLLATAQVSSGATRILWGAASDFLFHRRRKVVLAIMGFLTVAWLLGISLMSLGVPNIIVLSLAIVIGISTLSFAGVFAAITGELAEAGHVGVTVGVSSTMNRICMIIIPPLFGYLVDMTSSYSLAWRVAAALALVSTLALLAFGREPGRRQPSGIT